MIKAYICHPYSNDPEGNIAKVNSICADIAKESVSHMKKELNYLDHTHNFLNCYNEYQPEDAVVVPVAPHLLFPKFMSEDGGVSRNAAMAFCLGLMSICDELWVCSEEVTEGMRREIEYASIWNKRIVFWGC